MEKAIEVRGLQKSYKQLHVLKVVDFEVEKGSVLPYSIPRAREKQQLSESWAPCLNRTMPRPN